MQSEFFSLLRQLRIRHYKQRMAAWLLGLTTGLAIGGGILFWMLK